MQKHMHTRRQTNSWKVVAQWPTRELDDSKTTQLADSEFVQILPQSLRWIHYSANRPVRDLTDREFVCRRIVFGRRPS